MQAEGLLILDKKKQILTALDLKWINNIHLINRLKTVEVDLNCIYKFYWIMDEFILSICH